MPADMWLKSVGRLDRPCGCAMVTHLRPRPLTPVTQAPAFWTAASRPACRISHPCARAYRCAKSCAVRFASPRSRNHLGTVDGSHMVVELVPAGAAAGFLPRLRQTRAESPRCSLPCRLFRVSPSWRPCSTLSTSRSTPRTPYLVRRRDGELRFLRWSYVLVFGRRR